MKLDSIRREYNFTGLNEKRIEKDPLLQFEIWINEILKSGIIDATAMSLVTLGTDGFPQSRIVLLKDFSKNGFTFFSDYLSEKGRSISNNNKVGLHFFWPEFERQIRISGIAKKTSDEISSQYFKSRPVESQVAAIASNQSKIIASREALESKFKQAEQSGELKRPANWGGYIVKPLKFEFWQGRENRLHDRMQYLLENNSWKIYRLSP